MQCLTHLAPEPRDINWSSISYSPMNARVREWIVMAAMVVLQFFWFIPISALASLLSPEEIRKVMPWLSKLMDRHEHLGAMMNTISSLGMVTLNATLPFLLEGMYIHITLHDAWLRNPHRIDVHPGIPCQKLDRVLRDEEVSIHSFNCTL